MLYKFVSKINTGFKMADHKLILLCVIFCFRFILEGLQTIWILIFPFSMTVISFIDMVSLFGCFLMTKC